MHPRTIALLASVVAVILALFTSDNAAARVSVSVSPRLIHGSYQDALAEHAFTYTLDTQERTLTMRVVRSVVVTASGANNVPANTVDGAGATSTADVEWKRKSNSTLRALFTGTPERWFGIGWNPTHAGMRSTDMLFIRNIIQPVQNSTDPHATVDACLITDRWSSGPFEPRLDTAQGGREDWTLLLQSFTRVPGGSTDVTGEGYAGSTLDGNSTTLVAECIVQRKLDTGDTATDHPIHNTTLALAVAYGDIEAGILQRHRKGTIQAMEVNFFEGFTVERNTGGRGGDGSESGRRLRSLLFWHGALLTVAWFLLMVPGVWLARYFKVIVPAWFKHHWRVQAVAVVIALVAVLLAFVDKRYYFDPSPHSILGLTIVALILLQVLLGYLSNALWHAGKPPHFFPDKLHWYCGRLALVLGIVNIYLGTREYVMAFDVRAAAGGWAVVGVMGAVVVGATIMMEWGMGQKHEHEQLEREEREERYARFESMPLINGDVDVPGAAAPLLSSDGGADPTSTAAATSSLARQGCVRGSWSRNVAIGFFTLTMLKLCVLVGGFLVALLYE